MDPTSSSSSSMSRMKNYDVFLSSRVIDIQSSFMSQLYYYLRQEGMRIFDDSEELKLGDGRLELFDAIEGSSVAIVVFSKNYGRSKWCVDKLQKTMEVKEEGKLTVIPIFYHVSPGEMRLHENVSETVQRWIKALWEGSDGITVGQGPDEDEDEDEADVVQQVVGDVLKILNRHVHLEVA